MNGFLPKNIHGRSSKGTLCCLLILVLLAVGSCTSGDTRERIVVGSKPFAESYVLAEIFAQLLEAEGFQVDRRFNFGGTLVTYEALKRGEIDLYPEYTGTITQTILKQPALTEANAINEALVAEGLRILPSLGFNNSYAIAVPAELADELGLTKISDLRDHSELRFGISHEFQNREDGWPGLVAAYALDARVTGIEHALAYQAIRDGHVDVTDAYSTDGDIERYGLVTLVDDRGYFPEYLAVPLIREDLAERAKSALELLADSFDDERMRSLNARAVVENEAFASIATDFLFDQGLMPERTVVQRNIWRNLVRNTAQHLKLTGIALLLACTVGLAVALLVFRSKPLSRGVIYVAGLLQTVPSIALLALMIPLFGIGEIPAIIALFLYSLLPIVRNTITALVTIDPTLRRVAVAMGLTPLQQIRHVTLPLALPNVLAGIRTAAVISIGTATLAAFIGAGGLGDPIVTGLTLNDPNLIMQGAIPAAILAILTELAFERLERRLVPPHMLSATV